MTLWNLNHCKTPVVVCSCALLIINCNSVLLCVCISRVVPQPTWLRLPSSQWCPSSTVFTTVRSWTETSRGGTASWRRTFTGCFAFLTPLKRHTAQVLTTAPAAIVFIHQCTQACVSFELICDDYFRQCKLIFYCTSPTWGSGSAVSSAEGRYSTMGRATAASVGNMLLQSRIRSSSNPDIPAPHSSAEDNEVTDILSFKVDARQQQRQKQTQSRFTVKRQQWRHYFVI